MAENLKKILNDERVRAKGMVKFILIVGFIRFALPVTVISKIILYVLNYGLTGAYIEEFFTGHRLLFYVIEFLFEGITFGWIMWVWGKKEGYPNLNQ
jgi:hypothetical protein